MTAKITSVEKHDTYNEIVFRSKTDFEFHMLVDKVKGIVTVEKIMYRNQSDKSQTKPYLVKVYHGTIQELKSRFGTTENFINYFY